MTIFKDSVGNIVASAFLAKGGYRFDGSFMKRLSGETSVTEVTSDLTVEVGELCQRTYMNPVGGTSRSLTGSWWDGSAAKTLAPGQVVTVTLDTAGRHHIVSEFLNEITGGIGTLAIGTTFTVG